MISPKKVALIAATLIVVQCLIAGGVFAAELIAVTGGAAEDVETILAACLALVVGIMGTVFWGARQLIKAMKDDEAGALWKLYANQINQDTDLRPLLKKLLDAVDKHERALEPLVEEYMLRRAENETGRPWEKD